MGPWDSFACMLQTLPPRYFVCSDDPWAGLHPPSPPYSTPNSRRNYNFPNRANEYEFCFENFVTSIDLIENVTDLTCINYVIVHTLLCLSVPDGPYL